MYKELVGKIVDQARDEESNLVIWDRRDTFTVETEDVEKIEVTDDYLRVDMQEGKATVYVQLESIYKLVVEKERSGKNRSGARTGFGAV
ncbi:MAG: hypothetical protein ACR2HO_07340 [Rubrobacteraceae bacterium]|jgi:hypothetical protein|nr:hypothetical protein [Rubrobacter sp.]